MTHTDQTEPAKSHTAGPWWIDDDGFISAGSGDTYCTVADPHCRPTSEYGEENEANARRIVAAVNACEGIPTEALDQGGIADVLAALRSIRVALQYHGHWKESMAGHLLSIADTAIARVSSR